MGFNKEFLLRILLILSGVGIIVFALFNIWLNLSPIINGIVSGEDLSPILNSVNKSIFKDLFIFLIIGFLVFEIGITWRDLLKSISKIAVSFGVFFISISIFYFVAYSYSDNIVNSIQPSIDYVLAGSVEDIYNKYNENLTDVNLKLILSSNNSLDIFYVRNLSSEQAKLIFNELNLTYSGNNSIELSKILISSIYDDLLRTNKDLLKVPIPLSSVKDFITKNGIDLNLFNTLPIDVIEQSFPIDNSARIKFITSTNEKILDVNTAKIDNNDLELIWDNLGLNSSISIESKRKISRILLIYLYNSIEKYNLNDQPIPLNSISSLIPENYKKALNYDILNDNISIRKNNIVKLRNDCFNGFDIDEICSNLKLTEYSYLMQSNITSDLPFNISSKLNNIDNLNKLNIFIKDKTSKWLNYLIYAFISFIIAFISYFYHFKFFSNEKYLNIKLKIMYFISKLNILNYIFFFIFITLFYYILNFKLIEYISNLTDLPISSSLILKLPLLNVLIDLNSLIFNLSLIYFILSIVIFGVFYYLNINNHIEKEEIY